MGPSLRKRAENYVMVLRSHTGVVSCTSNLPQVISVARWPSSLGVQFKQSGLRHFCHRRVAANSYRDLEPRQLIGNDVSNIPSYTASRVSVFGPVLRAWA